MGLWEGAIGPDAFAEPLLLPEQHRLLHLGVDEIGVLAVVLAVQGGVLPFREGLGGLVHRLGERRHVVHRLGHHVAQAAHVAGRLLLHGEGRALLHHAVARDHQFRLQALLDQVVGPEVVLHVAVGHVGHAVLEVQIRGEGDLILGHVHHQVAEAVVAADVVDVEGRLAHLQRHGLAEGRLHHLVGPHRLEALEVLRQQLLAVGHAVLERRRSEVALGTRVGDDRGVGQAPEGDGAEGVVRVVVGEDEVSDGLIRVRPDGLHPLPAQARAAQGVDHHDAVAGLDEVGVTVEAAVERVDHADHPVGGGDAVNDTVRAAAIAANGDIYIGGNFVNCGGAGGDYIAYFDLSAGSWSPVSGGGTGTVYAVDFDARGNFWFGGDFTDWNSNVSIDHIGYWDGAAYQAAGSGADGIIYDLLMLGESVYAVGAFTTPGDSAASWNGTSWTDLNPNGTVGQARMMAVSADGSIYMWDYANETIVRFTGASFVQIGTISRSGRTANIQAMAETPNGELWVSGLFDSVDGIDNTEYMARWTGSAWAPFPVTAQEPFLAMEFYNQDPMVENNFHAWIGAGGSGTSYEIPITETFTNNGDAPAHLRLIFEQSSVKGTIRTIKSVTNGKQLFPNYTMLPGETVVIDIRETYVSVESDMRGSIPHALLVGGDEATFLLDPGDNVLELLVESSSANSSRVIGVWHDTFTGVD